MKKMVERAGYVLLGVLLTVIVMLLSNQIKKDKQTETSASQETVDIAETVSTTPDYEAEAEEKLKQLQQEQAAAKSNTAAAADVNTDATTKVLQWKTDYPTINSDKTLEEKQNERSSYEETMAVNAFDKKVIENNTIDFSNTKIAILGDSLTMASNLSEEDQKKYAYPVQLQQILGCKEIYNLGIGGSTVSRCADASAMVDRWGEIPQDTDIIIVFGGSNDCLFENKWEYGFIEYDQRMTNGTFCGDLDEMLSGIKYVYREHHEGNYIKFLYINPPSTILNDGVYAIDPGNMVQQSAFAEAINTIAPSYEFDVIDLYNNNILNSHDKEVNANLMPDGIHPNAEGYTILAQHIASQIIQRIEQ